MAKKPLYNSNTEAAEATMDIARLRASIETIKHLDGFDVRDPKMVCAVGKSLMNHVYDLCEIILHFICRKMADEMELTEWPRIKDLSKKDNPIVLPVDVRVAVSTMKDIKSECDKTFVEPDELKAFFFAVSYFVNWANEVLGGGKESEPARYLIDLIGRWYGHFEKENKSLSDEHRLYQIYYGEGGIEKYSDEEIDEIHKRRKGNKMESMASLYIYLILKNHHSSKKNPFHTKDIKDYLWKDYEIDLGRGAIERALITLEASGDTNIWKGTEKGSGYWYSEKDENAEE